MTRTLRCRVAGIVHDRGSIDKMAGRAASFEEETTVVLGPWAVAVSVELGAIARVHRTIVCLAALAWSNTVGSCTRSSASS